MLKGHEIGGNYDHVYYAYARGVLDSIARAEFVLNLFREPCSRWGRLVLAPLYHRIRFETDAPEFRIQASSLSADTFRRIDCVAIPFQLCFTILQECLTACSFFFFITRPSSRKNPVHKMSLRRFFFFLSWWKLLTCCKNSIQSLSVKVSYPGCFSWIMYKSVPLKVYIS